jgi:hypothetical protein
VLRIKTKAGSRDFTSGEEGPELGYVLRHHYPISSRTRRRTLTSPFIKPFLWILSSKYDDRVITIMGCYKKSMECTKASSNIAEALVVAEEKRRLHQQVALTQPRRPAPSQPASNLKSANDAKKIPPEVDKMAKVVDSEAGLSAK